MRRLSAVRLGWPLAAIAIVAVAFVGCEGEIAESDVAGPAPWSDGERAEYRILNDDGESIGTAVFTIERDGDDYLLSQTIDTEEADDSTTVRVRAGDMKPVSTHRVIDGKDGHFEIDSSYTEEEGRVIVHAFDGEERQSASNDVPPFSYDTRESLFLWRTLPLAEDYEGAYRAMLSTVTQKPDDYGVTIRVSGGEAVTVPAGEYEAWKLRATVNNSRETAWIARESPHPLVRYDSGTVVFELESYEP